MKNIFRILDQLKLDEQELRLVHFFKEEEKNPLAIAKILEKKGYINESCELLATFLKKDPKNKSIRAAYGKDLFNKGLIRDTAYVLSGDAELVFENLLACLLLFQAFVLLEEEAKSIKTCLIIEKNHKHSERTAKTANVLKNYGISKAKEILIEELESIGIEPILGPLSYAKQMVDFSDDKKIFKKEYVSDMHFTADSIKNDIIINDYKRLTLATIFSSKTDTFLSDDDATVMAQTYENQGQYEQSLRIFKDLFKKNQKSIYLKNKLQDLSKLILKQKTEDMSIDPVISEKIEALEKVDYKIDYLQSLLNKIESPPCQQSPSKF